MEEYIPLLIFWVLGCIGTLIALIIHHLLDEFNNGANPYNDVLNISYSRTFAAWPLILLGLIIKTVHVICLKLFK